MCTFYFISESVDVLSYESRSGFCTVDALSLGSKFFFVHANPTCPKIRSVTAKSANCTYFPGEIEIFEREISARADSANSQIKNGGIFVYFQTVNKIRRGKQVILRNAYRINKSYSCDRICTAITRVALSMHAEVQHKLHKRVAKFTAM